MALAAHLANVYVKATNAAPVGADELQGIKDFSAKSSKTMLDVTDFQDTSAAHKRLAGLEDGNFTIAGDFLIDSANAPQSLVRSSFNSGADIFLTVLVDGTNGFTYPCKVQDYEIKGAVDGLVLFSATLLMTGAKITRP